MATLVKVHPDGYEEFKDGGARVEAIKYYGDGKYEVVGNKPIIGCSLLVGSVTARSYSRQDYWLTTAVTEIIEENDSYILFRTGNSTYKLIK